MPARLADAALEGFSPAWRVGWRGPHRYAMLTASLADPTSFVAYGTDGHVAFRVRGTWRVDLSRFMDRMAIDGVELLSPPRSVPARPPGQSTFPDLLTVQRCFDARLAADESGVRSDDLGGGGSR